ncbi:hypothetical protein cyc_04378 [Cyclospora cayetanensis]|uniref:Uncharacterized protein n=1 Tax=Cyclospora cayetanensis TaxID=88456 RepID=A0A1D3CSH9_9EIME|nr:hypothetical protein cyc_04378 [Cyclospora cayetanensis]
MAVGPLRPARLQERRADCARGSAFNRQKRALQEQRQQQRQAVAALASQQGDSVSRVPSLEASLSSPFHASDALKGASPSTEGSKVFLDAVPAAAAQDLPHANARSAAVCSGLKQGGKPLGGGGEPSAGTRGPQVAPPHSGACSPPVQRPGDEGGTEEGGSNVRGPEVEGPPHGRPSWGSSSGQNGSANQISGSVYALLADLDC